MLYFNTNKPHSFFCRIPVVLENRRSSRGGGVRTPCTLPLDPPLVGFFCFHALGNTKQKRPTPLNRGPPLNVNRVYSNNGNKRFQVKNRVLISFHLTLSDFCLYFYCILLSSMVVEESYVSTGELVFTVFRLF